MEEKNGKETLLTAIRQLEELVKDNSCELEDATFHAIADSIVGVMNNKYKQVVSREGASRMLGVSTRTFGRLISSGEIPRGTRNGHRELSWRAKDIFAFVKRNKEK